MTDQSPEHTQFFLTATTPCPYLPGQQERKLFTHLNGRRAQALHHLLSDHGFRRSQNLIYRPACEGCAACLSVRISLDGHAPDRRQQRVLRTNADLDVSVRPAVATAEQFDLFSRYVRTRHDDGGMAGMTFVDFEYMVEDTPVDSRVIEYRLRDENGLRGALVGAVLTDVMADGLSMVYSFYDPEQKRRSLGTYMILDHVRLAASDRLGYVYLGYWVKNSPKMAYKAQFRPLEIQAGSRGWLPLEDIDPAL